MVVAVIYDNSNGESKVLSFKTKKEAFYGYLRLAMVDIHWLLNCKLVGFYEIGNGTIREIPQSEMM